MLFLLEKTIFCVESKKIALLTLFLGSRPWNVFLPKKNAYWLVNLLTKCTEFCKGKIILLLQVFISLGFKDIEACNFNDVLSAKRPFKRSDTIHFYT